MHQLTSGSPPPMRGKVPLLTALTSFVRITPAYAGKRERFDLFNAGMWDHPRLCGEKRSLGKPLLSRVGSPPPMRGKASDGTAVAGGIRITPAYAGKSFHFPFKRTAVRDHPRLCGEKEIVFLESRLTEGSPPPMRGKVSPPDFRNFITGITPAYAGKRRTFKA